MKKRIDVYADSCREEAEELLMDLGKIPAPSHMEDQRAAFCAEWFKKNTSGEVSVDAAKNVICRFGNDPDKRCVVMMAHMDVVFPDMTPLPMVREDHILRAPGIGDDTANLVNLMMASRYLSEQQDRLDRNILIVANSCEEGLGNLDGAKQIFKDYGDLIDEFISLDGSLGGITDRPVGSHRYCISVNTQGGHSYGDFGRDNAIEIAARVIQALYGTDIPTRIKTTRNVGTISGGSTVNSIAQHCEFLYEYRSEDQSCLSEMQQHLHDVLKLFTDEGKDVRCEVLGIRPGMGEMDMASYACYVDRCTDAVKEYYDGDIHIGAGSTDANVPLSLGIHGVTIGTVSGHGAHTREEWVDLNGQPIGLRIALRLLENWLKAA